MNETAAGNRPRVLKLGVLALPAPAAYGTISAAIAVSIYATKQRLLVMDEQAGKSR